jgi:hypothetical protein
MKKVLLLVLALFLFSSRTTAQGIRNFTDDDLKKVLGKCRGVLVTLTEFVSLRIRSASF